MLPLLLSLGITLAATPVAVRVARRTGFLDRPLGYKGHASPTPYLGGAAVTGGFLVAAGAIAEGPVWLLATGTAILAVVGTMDDRFTVTPFIRVAVEGLLGVVLFAAGLGWSLFASDAANLVLTLIWVVGVVNAFNLMDNMDGSAATTAAVSATAVASVALMVDKPVLGGLGLCLAGACLGFLPYNLSNPARIFLGDGGSMPIGFLIAALAMALPVETGSGAQQLAIGVLLAGLPILDTSLVLVSRLRAGVSVVRGGRDHLTHRLRFRLGSPRLVALVLGATQAALGFAALSLASAQSEPAGAIALAAVIVAGVSAIVALEGPSWGPERVNARAPAT